LVALAATKSTRSKGANAGMGSNFKNLTPKTVLSANDHAYDAEEIQ